MGSARDKFVKYCNDMAECRKTVHRFNQASYDKFGSYSYAAGYLETLVADLMMDVSKARRQEIMQQLDKMFADKETV